MASEKERTKFLSELYKKKKGLKPSQVVRAAKPASSPIHDEFEWDDAQAAEQHRLAQARHIIRITPIKIGRKPAAKMVHIPSVTIEQPTAAVTDREGIYRVIPEVAADTDEYEIALKYLLTQIRGLERKVTALKKAAKAAGQQVDDEAYPALRDGLKIAKDSLRLMLETAAA